MNVVVSDIKIIEVVNYDDLMKYKDVLDSVIYICLDVNFSEYLIIKICKNYGYKFIIVEGVFFYKILKFKFVL